MAKRGGGALEEYKKKRSEIDKKQIGGRVVNLTNAIDLRDINSLGSLVSGPKIRPANRSFVQLFFSVGQNQDSALVVPKVERKNFHGQTDSLLNLGACIGCIVHCLFLWLMSLRILVYIHLCYTCWTVEISAVALLCAIASYNLYTAYIHILKQTDITD